MIAWETLDSANIPGGGQLRLKRRGQEYSIMLGANELMNSRLSGSEEALATLALARLGEAHRPSVLIGGLGMGFTLRAALSALGPSASVVVAELVPAIVDWARGPMGDLFAGCLDDRRVAIRIEDVGAVMASEAGGFDAILLDVDNGPEGLSRQANDALYDHRGLASAWRALRVGGVLAVWSSGPDAAFTRRLEQSGFTVEVVGTRARGKRGARHVIWLATRQR